MECLNITYLIFSKPKQYASPLYDKKISVLFFSMVSDKDKEERRKDLFKKVFNCYFDMGHLYCKAKGIMILQYFLTIS